MEAKSILASKTFWVNVAAILATVIGSPEFAAIIPESWMVYIPPALGMMNIVLRTVTSKPVKIGV